MKRRPFCFCLIGLIGLGILAELLPAALTASAAGAKPPNLVLVFPDQMRGQAMGFVDEEPVLTPHLDRFASQAIVCTQAVSNYPVCSPFRAMLMTGKYPHANGVISNCTSRTAELGIQLSEKDRCWSDVLNDKGYALGYIGKWHLEGPHQPFVDSYNNRPNFAWNEWTPPNRRHGFAFWYAYNTFDRHLTPKYWSTTMTRDEREKVTRWGPEHEADLAIQYIANEDGKYRDRSKPFALVVSMNPPHTPYNLVPEHYAARYKAVSTESLCRRPNIPPKGTQWGDQYRKNIRNYYAMITGVDEQFGRILQAIDEAHLTSDTVVVFTSDHGNCLGIHESVTKNVHWEESMRIPLLIRYPGRIKPHQDDLLISVPDLYPTLLGLLGLADAIPSDVQGTSYAKLLQDGKGSRPISQLYLWIPYDHPELGRRGLRTHRYTLMIDKTDSTAPKFHLYDNLHDPYQLENIAGKKPDVVLELVERELKPWLERTGDPWQTP